MQRIFNLMAFASFVCVSAFVGISFYAVYQLDSWEKQAAERLTKGVKEKVEAELSEKLEGKLDGIKKAMPTTTGPALPF